MTEINNNAINNLKSDSVVKVNFVNGQRQLLCKNIILNVSGLLTVCVRDKLYLPTSLFDLTEASVGVGLHGMTK